MSEILFIYAKVNSGIKYVQGMNEVLAVLYYCFWKFNNEALICTDYLESDIFFCFTSIMAEIRDGFIRDLDKEASGIFGKCNTIESIILTM